MPTSRPQTRRSARRTKGEGPYAKGRPRRVRAADGHVSNPRRFTDSGFEVVPWTEEMALRAAGVDPDAPRGDQVALLEGAELPPEALEALVKAGWRELRDRTRL